MDLCNGLLATKILVSLTLSGSRSRSLSLWLSLSPSLPPSFCSSLLQMWLFFHVFFFNYVHLCHLTLLDWKSPIICLTDLNNFIESNSQADRSISKNVPPRPPRYTSVDQRRRDGHSAHPSLPLQMSFSALMAPDPRAALVTQCDTVLKRQKAADYVIEDDAGALKGHVQPLSSCHGKATSRKE